MSVSARILFPNGLEALVNRLYRYRFSPEILAQRIDVWKELYHSWFVHYIPKTGRFLEIACGYCEFINTVEARERVGIDLNPESKHFAAPGVTIHEIAADRLAERLDTDYFDTAFLSNFLEHCRSRDEMLAVLRAVARTLKPGGQILILGPNFRYCYKRYFDYFDHYLPLTENAVVEALHLAGFEPERVLPRTLPYTFRSKAPKWPWLVRLYLRWHWLWPLFGAQFFVVGRKPAESEGAWPVKVADRLHHFRNGTGHG